MKNVLTVDVEDWFQTMDFNFSVDSWQNYEDRIEYGMKTILDLLDRHNVKATFFVLGYEAKKHPGLIREIVSKGHEIGSHGNLHRMITTQNREEFIEDAALSKEILQDITGKRINLYRSSSWSIIPKTLWALEVLEELGFEYDSSIQPFTTPLSGFRKAPLSPFYPVVSGRKLNILEFPTSVLPVGRICFPFCGGLYLRVLPTCFIIYSLKKVNERTPGMIYVHPWELDMDQPRLKVPAHIRFTHYHNINTTARKLENLLQEFEFTTFSELLKEGGFPAIALK